MPSVVPVPASADGGGADRPVAAADDQQRITAFGGRAAARRAFAAVDQLDLGVDSGCFERRGDFFADLRVGRGPRRRRG